MRAFRCLYLEFQLSFDQNANRLIYAILNFRPLKGLISEEWYVRRDIKRVAGILYLLWRSFWGIIVEAAYFLLVCLPGLIMTGIFDLSRETFAENVVWSFFFLNGMIGSLGNSHIVRTGDQEKYLLLNLMRVDPKVHFLTEIIWEYGKKALFYGVVFLVLMPGICGCPRYLSVWLMVCYVCLRPVGEAVRLKLCQVFGMPFQEHSRVAAGGYYAYCAVMVLLAYGMYPMLIFFQGIPRVVHNPVFDAGNVSLVLLGSAVVSAALAAVWAVRYLCGYPDYVLVARRMYSISRMSEKAAAAEAAKTARYQFQEKDVAERELQTRIFPDKTGYEYLHAIFFYRHKKLVRNAVRWKTAVVGGVFGLGAAALLIAGILMPAAAFRKLSDEIWSCVNTLLPILVFIMYCVSSGQSLTQAMFYNCDISLLKYGYYRTPSAILMSFRIRLRYMLRAQLPAVGAMCGGFLLDSLLLRRFADLGQVVAILCCMGILMIFFSVVFLCMYYIFQPFTEGGNTTGIGYKICNTFLYIFSYTCLRIHTPPAYFAGLVLAVTIVVMILALMLVWWLAPQTFRLK